MTASCPPAGAAEHEERGDDGLARGPFHGDRVGRELAAVGGQLLRREGPGAVSRHDPIRLVVHDDQAVGSAVQQVDVALQHGVAEGHPDVHLPPVGQGRRFGHARRGQRGAGQAGDALPLVVDALGRRLRSRQGFETVAGGEIDHLEDAVDGPADGGAVAAPAPRRQVQVHRALGQARLDVVGRRRARQLLEPVIVAVDRHAHHDVHGDVDRHVGGAGRVRPERLRGQPGGGDRTGESGGGDELGPSSAPGGQVGHHRWGWRGRGVRHRRHRALGVRRKQDLAVGQRRVLLGRDHAWSEELRAGVPPPVRLAGIDAVDRHRQVVPRPGAGHVQEADALVMVHLLVDGAVWRRSPAVRAPTGAAGSGRRCRTRPAPPAADCRPGC